MIRVWDPLVRAFHWSLVVAFAVAWLSAEEWSGLHEWAGYAAAALIALRILWGFVGTRYARFSQFVRGPGAVLRYLREVLARREARYIGHNPVGAVMILAILVVMSATAYTGWLMEDPARQALFSPLPPVVATALADDDDAIGAYGGEEGLEEVHEILADLMLVLVVLHLGGVVLASIRHRENLARAMITGDKRKPEPGDID